MWWLLQVLVEASLPRQPACHGQILANTLVGPFDIYFFSFCKIYKILGRLEVFVLVLVLLCNATGIRLTSRMNKMTALDVVISRSRDSQLTKTTCLWWSGISIPFYLTDADLLDLMNYSQLETVLHNKELQQQSYHFVYNSLESTQSWLATWCVDTLVGSSCWWQNKKSNNIFFFLFLFFFSLFLSRELNLQCYLKHTKMTALVVVVISSLPRKPACDGQVSANNTLWWPPYVGDTMKSVGALLLWSQVVGRVSVAISMQKKRKGKIMAFLRAWGSGVQAIWVAPAWFWQCQDETSPPEEAPAAQVLQDCHQNHLFSWVPPSTIFLVITMKSPQPGRMIFLLVALKSRVQEPMWQIAWGLFACSWQSTETLTLSLLRSQIMGTLFLFLWVVIYGTLDDLSANFWII